MCCLLPSNVYSLLFVLRLFSGYGFLTSRVSICVKNLHDGTSVSPMLLLCAVPWDVLVPDPKRCRSKFWPPGTRLTAIILKTVSRCIWRQVDLALTA